MYIYYVYIHTYVNFNSSVICISIPIHINMRFFLGGGNIWRFKGENTLLKIETTIKIKKLYFLDMRIENLQK